MYRPAMGFERSKPLRVRSTCTWMFYVHVDSLRARGCITWRRLIFASVGTRTMCCCGSPRVSLSSNPKTVLHQVHRISANPTFNSSIRVSSWCFDWLHSSTISLTSQEPVLMEFAIGTIRIDLSDGNFNRNEKNSSIADFTTKETFLCPSKSSHLSQEKA